MVFKADNIIEIKLNPLDELYLHVQLFKVFMLQPPSEKNNKSMKSILFMIFRFMVHYMNIIGINKDGKLVN